MSEALSEKEVDIQQFQFEFDGKSIAAEFRSGPGALDGVSDEDLKPLTDIPIGENYEAEMIEKLQEESDLRQLLEAKNRNHKRTKGLLEGAVELLPNSTGKLPPGFTLEEQELIYLRNIRKTTERNGMTFIFVGNKPIAMRGFETRKGVLKDGKLLFIIGKSATLPKFRRHGLYTLISAVTQRRLEAANVNENPVISVSKMDFIVNKRIDAGWRLLSEETINKLFDPEFAAYLRQYRDQYFQVFMRNIILSGDHPPLPPGNTTYTKSSQQFSSGHFGPGDLRQPPHE